MHARQRTKRVSSSWKMRYRRRKESDEKAATPLSSHSGRKRRVKTEQRRGSTHRRALLRASRKKRNRSTCCPQWHETADSEQTAPSRAAAPRKEKRRPELVRNRFSASEPRDVRVDKRVKQHAATQPMKNLSTPNVPDRSHTWETERRNGKEGRRCVVFRKRVGKG